MIPLLKKLAKVSDVRPFIKKIVKKNKISYKKVNKVFKGLEESMDELAHKREFDRDKHESVSKQVISAWKENMDIERPREHKHHHIQSQYKPIVCKSSEEVASKFKLLESSLSHTNPNS